MDEESDCSLSALLSLELDTMEQATAVAVLSHSRYSFCNPNSSTADSNL